ncbi:hypothetical protein HZ326_29346 [Fusarium oxysporum f. sp. albedinis]|nr:hypothetical protein HZ326_29346 [Fusarium oxysporum f. sp. albedinis]
MKSELGLRYSNVFSIGDDTSNDLIGLIDQCKTASPVEGECHLLSQAIKFPIYKPSSNLRKWFDKIGNSAYVMLKRSSCKMPGFSKGLDLGSSVPSWLYSSFR